MKTVTDYELIDHGLEDSQYFQGCATCYTPFDHVVTGIGMNPAEAIEDCLEQIAWTADADALETRILADEGWPAFPVHPDVCDGCDGCDGSYGEFECEVCQIFYHVSIRFNLTD